MYRWAHKCIKNPRNRGAFLLAGTQYNIAMREDIARRSFEKIRDRPYRVATSVHTPAANCYFKAMELVKILTTLGYETRGRLGEIDWADTPCPPEILVLRKEGVIDTHFYLEICLDGQWKTLDPSWNKAFAVKFGLDYSEFGEDNQTCFKITKLYDLEQQANYAWGWLSDETTIQRYMEDMGPFLTALNEWLSRENP